MIPYGDFTFFLIALIALLPVIILGFLGKRSYIYNGVVTAFMIVLIFSSDKHNLFDQKYLSVQLISFIIYVVWQVLLIMFYYHSKPKNNSFFKICNCNGFINIAISTCESVTKYMVRWTSDSLP